MPAELVSHHDLLANYVQRNFSLVFWTREEGDPEGKGPRDKGWPLKTFDPAHFRPGMQLGVKIGVEVAPGMFLLDVDFDWEPAIPYADKFLPHTGFGFGRTSKPHGHAFYTTSHKVTYFKFTDTDNSTLVERRGTKKNGTIGHQTVLPPSVHYKSGEIVTLSHNGPIAHNDEVIDGI